MRKSILENVKEKFGMKEFLKIAFCRKKLYNNFLVDNLTQDGRLLPAYFAPSQFGEDILQKNETFFQKTLFLDDFF